MTTKTCAFCGERAYRLPFANGDEWVDSKGNRWLFHKCREGGAARSQSRPLKPGPGNLPVKVSTEKLRRIQSRIASESRKEEEKRAALKKKKKAEARKAGIARSIEAKKSRKTSLRHKTQYEKNLFLFEIVSKEVDLISLDDFLIIHGLKKYSRSEVLRKKLRKYISDQVFAQEDIMQKYDKYVNYHMALHKKKTRHF